MDKINQGFVLVVVEKTIGSPFKGVVASLGIVHRDCQCYSLLRRPPSFSATTVNFGRIISVISLRHNNALHFEIYIQLVKANMYRRISLAAIPLVISIYKYLYICHAIYVHFWRRKEEELYRGNYEVLEGKLKRKERNREDVSCFSHP